MDSVTYLMQFESCDDIGNGDFSRIHTIADEYAAIQAENDRLKAERVDLEQFRKAVQWARMHALTDDFLYDCSRLLALIDAHKGE